MDKPVRAADMPYSVFVEAGKTYYWCSCGKSQGQPFCDGSHAGTLFSPLQYGAVEAKKVHFCGCKQTKSAPCCDGSHNDV
jgi:CDGSH-type Zn-finger protein